MSDFTIASRDTGNLDSYKRVNYEHGMVLGVDEFLQEEFYLLTRDRRHNRGLHGYGTVCGLAISKEMTAEDGWKITVSSGIGINPQGQEIRVPADQCALLDEWLAGNTEGLPQTGSVGIDLILCYRECETDKVPVPSGPCQSLEETMAASRIVDDFELRFTTQRPRHVEAQVIRFLFDRLNEIEVSQDPTNFNDEELIEYIRSFIPDEDATGSPPSSPPQSWAIVEPPPFLVGSLPEPANMHVEDARRLLRLALRIWVTEVRPRLLEGDKNCVSGPPDEQCLLLAELDFDVADRKVDGDVEINEDNRPYLISTRALQEHLLDRAASPAEGGITAHSDLSHLTDSDDHLQYLRTDGSRALAGEWSAGDNKIINLAAATDDFDAVRLEQVNAIIAAHGHGEFLRIDGSTPLGGEWSAGNNKITDLALATDPNDAVTFGQLNDSISTHDHAEFLRHDGSRPLTGNLPAGNRRITNLGDPTANRDAVNLRYARQNFVGAVAGPYRIVAAGRFLLESGDPIGPVYNQLRVRPVNQYPEVLQVHFSGYRDPTTPDALAKFAYVVKAMFEGVGEKTVSAVVQLIGFGEDGDGFFVRVVPVQAVTLDRLIEDRNAPFPLKPERFARPGISIEISEFDG